ncbi:MAG: tyramine oxidase, partial [Alphaproteobacteria bacterium]
MADAPHAAAATLPPLFVHPLDPLSEREIGKAVEIVKTAKGLADTMRFAMVRLEEPAKAAVLAWAPGVVLARQAFIVLFDNKSGRTFEAIVDITHKAVVSYVERPVAEAPYGQPPVIVEEFFKAEAIVKADARWRAAIKRRGLTDADIEKVQVDPFSAGFFDREVERGRRLVGAVSYYREDMKDNGYAHPIEGVVALVDLINEVVVDLIDEPDV